MSRAVDWGRVKELFTRALDQAPERRDAWLEQACGGDAAMMAEVRSLLTARAAPDRIAGGVAQLLSPLAADEQSTLDAGAQVGAYRLLRQLGVGGMGRVYLAERADGQFRHEVALKLVRSELAAPELVQRFLRERDTLARLAHPNIAQLHDGGVSADGSPYFTLEYVDGQPITDWCDAHHLGIRSRVKLLLKVCDAVEHAHRNLIVHRDIKPTNILVTTAGEPKLLDFGIAKPLEVAGTELTGAQARPMTREYAAPEQILGDPITTATDVYSLGVLLYLLLSGRMPYRRAALGQTSWAKAILEEQPESLDRAITRTAMHPASTGPEGFAPHASSALDPEALAAARSTTALGLQRMLRGDLERIAQRAMAKSPATRYTTVSALAHDLNAYLDGRAISGGTRTYRLRKFVRRYWLPLGAAATLLIVIIGGALLVAADARQIAREAQTTTAVKEFLVGLFRGADPQLTNGKDITARALVEQGVARITTMHDQPLLRGELEGVLGEIENDLGQPDTGRKIAKQAVADLEANGGSPLLIAASEREQARAELDLDNPEGSIHIAADAAQRLRSVTPLPVVELARVTGLQAHAAVLNHDINQAASLAEETLRLSRLPGMPPDVLADNLAIASDIAHWHRDYDRADELSREKVRVLREAYGERDPRVAVALADLAATLEYHGHLRPALAANEEALRVAAATLTPTDQRVLGIKVGTVHQLVFFGDYAAAEKLLAEAKQGLEADHIDDGITSINFLDAEYTLALGKSDLATAEQVVTQRLATAERLFGSGSMQVELGQIELHWLRGRRGNPDAAYTTLGAMLQRMLDKGRTPYSQLLWRLGDIEVMVGRNESAVAHIRHAIELKKSSFADIGNIREGCLRSLAAAYAAAGQEAEAEESLREAIAAGETKADGAVTPSLAMSNLQLAKLLAQHADRRAEALKLVQIAYPALHGFHGDNDERTAQAQALLAHLQAVGM